ncbi:hypothetical protein C4K38_3720 [Pseudomonas chlororaphis subsp. piscium]|nr:hypothetical protein C4K38_3720 [Pseudomonas chlororaphis subsp. piscium]
MSWLQRARIMQRWLKGDFGMDAPFAMAHNSTSMLPGVTDAGGRL